MVCWEFGGSNVQHLKIEEAMYATLQLNLQVALYSELYVKVQKANKL